MVQGHASDEELELYSLGRLQEPELGAFEEHLLLCEQCQDRVEQEDELTRVTRRALQQVAAEPRNDPGPRRWFWPKALGAAGLALAASALFMLVRNPSPEDVQLIARRGAETRPVDVHRGAPLNLSVPAVEVPGSAAYTFEVVDADGGVVASRAATVEHGAITARTDGLRPGTYWVRLYGTGHQLLQEFSLAAR